MLAALKVLRGQQAPKVHREILVRPVLKARREIPVLPDLKGHKVPQAHRVLPVRRDRRVIRVRKDRLVRRVRRDHRGLWDRKVIRVPRARPALKGRLVHRVLRVPPALKVLLAPPEPKVPKAPKAPKDRRVQLTRGRSQQKAICLLDPRVHWCVLVSGRTVMRY